MMNTLANCQELNFEIPSFLHSRLLLIVNNWPAESGPFDDFLAAAADIVYR